MRAGPEDVDLKALFHPRIRCALPALPRTGTRYSLGFFSMIGLSPNNNDATVVAPGTTCSRRNDAGAPCGTSFSMNPECSRERCFQLPVHCRRTVLRLRRSAPLPPLSLRTIGVCSETTTVVCSNGCAGNPARTLRVRRHLASQIPPAGWAHRPTRVQAFPAVDLAAVTESP